MGVHGELSGNIFGVINMARLPHDASAGQTDSNAHPHTTVLDANAGHTLTLPGHEYVTDAQMLRDGQDLVLRPAHGEDVVVKNYFTADPAPVLSSADGGTALTHDLVDSFVKPIHGVQYAQNGSMDDASPVGVIKEASGDGTITHTNGTVQKAAIGVPIYEGDIVETKAHGAVNITFVDKTTFAVSENAKMAIDQYVFDPATQHGENNFSVLRGVFVFTSGLIGHADPDDVKIHTPVGSIGIRGTTIMGTISPGGDSHVSVVEGAIVVSNAAGEQTLSQQFETVKLNGMNQPIVSEGVQSADAMANNYNVLRTVSGPLFSTFDDMGKSHNDTPAQGNTPSHEAAPADDAPAKGAAPDTNAPVNKSDAVDPAAPVTLAQVTLDGSSSSLDNGFDASASLKTTTAFSNDGGVAATSGTSPGSLASIAATSTIGRSAFSIPATGQGTSSTAFISTVANTAPVSTATTSSTTAANGGTVTTLPAFTLSVSVITGASLSAGTRVATVTSSITTGVTFNWTSPTDGSGHELFTLTPLTGGTAGITLTTYGALYISSLINGGDIQYTVNATLTDGRTSSINSDVLIPASYDLSLNSVIGGTITAGATYIPSTGSATQQGSALAAFGDYNDDGRPDYVFTNNLSTAGILFIDDAQGNNYQVNMTGWPYAMSDTSKISIASAGDFNGDGKGDLIIGSYLSDGTQFSSGKVFIMTDPSGGGSGITVTGFASGDFAGASVAGIGDYNGDGYNDIIIGAPSTANNAKAYILLGHSGTATIDVSSLSPSNGFVISGGLGTASNVSGIGDFNHDGFSDFAITDMSANRVTFYYGGQTGTNTGSVAITGLSTGATPTIVSLGDANGDGSSDFGILDNVANKFYAFNGGASRGNTDFSVTSANYTFSPASGTITTVANAGDMNGDGINDIAVAIRNGTNMDIYVVYGGTTLTGTLNPASIANAYHMHLDLTSSQFNLANPATDAVTVNLSSAGDLNGDGYDDLLIGLPNIDKDGGAHSNDGGVLIINGSDNGSVTAGQTATASFQSLIGTTGSDVLSSGNAAITSISFNAGAGDDTIQLMGTNAARVIDGGSGIDTLYFGTGGTYDMRNVDLSGIEKLSVGNGGGQVITLTLDQVFNLLHTSQDNTLHIDNAGSGVQLNIDTNKSGSTMADAGFTDAGVSGNYHAYTQGAYTLYVDTSITTVAQNI